RLLDLPMPGLYGPHQVGNASLAVKALLTWGDPRIDEAALAKGVAGAVWPARFQRLTAGPLGAAAVARGADLWLDGAHNPHGGRALAETVDRLARDGRPVTLVVAQYARKDSVGFFEPLQRLGARVIATTFESTTALSPEDLAAAAAQAGLTAETAPDVTTATTMALAVDGPAPHVIICGGLHFAGEVLALSPDTWPT
ncbi:MAG: bifunctional folylpolyglutamate synthase/dihydrofolate synthase, partial [Phenylobacterium sp.]|nr:bifunctional folylpolyglutamate synthase/dihydrofolate synthase [Phenylobacterium sp.]